MASKSCAFCLEKFKGKGQKGVFGKYLSHLLKHLILEIPDTHIIFLSELIKEIEERIIKNRQLIAEEQNTANKQNGSIK
jgi:hypothetical protein